ncbi:MAG: ABC transporter ATP-binding protein [Legionella sp.]|nr:MAG: ABC transporter ATP-binding protein [Legionella sp.]
MSLVSFHGVTLILANTVILKNVDWQVHAKNRIGLVGRNGAGKSSLLKLLQGILVQDSGQVQKQQGLRVAGLAQDVPLDESSSVFEVIVQGLGEVGQVLLNLRQHTQAEDYDGMAKCHQRLDDLQAWDSLPRVETIASHLSLPLDAVMNSLSGGLKRRVLLAAAIVTQPDLLLLDEPTNHLDLPAIEWLESFLASYPGAVILVTHDRVFLSKVATCIVDLDRGQIHPYACSYELFLERREAVRMAEQKQDALFDKRLADEEVWIRTGVKARRTRNEGRVRALKEMRDMYQQRRQQQGQVKTLQLDVKRSGSLVIEAQHLNYQYEHKSIIQDFSLVLHRGEKLGIIGPNGCGKTTLVRLLLGEMAPDSGHVRLGTSLEIAYFDQLRRQLDPKKTVMANVADGAEHVIIQGKSKHVASYLQDFLFSPECFNQPVSSLSGGECNRLLLAKLLAKPANLLVLDEPTNDLDIETLELLETLLVEYPGTVLLISHDRAFINQVVTSVLVYEDDNRFHEYVGGYDTYQQYKLTQQPAAPIPVKPKPEVTPVVRTEQRKLSYQEQRELARLPQDIEVLEQTIQLLHQEYSSPEFYQRSSTDISHFQQNLAKEEAALAKMYARWEALEEK